MGKSRAAAIIIKDEKILLLKRRKPGREYFIIPGGGIEKGETLEMAAIREVKEETNLDVEIENLFFEFDGVYDRHEYFFTVKNIQGEASLGGEELENNSAENHYAIAWIALNELEKTLLLPEEIKQKIIERFCKQ